MDKLQFDAADPLIDEIAELLDQLLASQQFEVLKAKLAELSRIFEADHSVSLDCRLELCDQKQERSLPLLWTGLSAFAGEGPHQTWNDSSPQRYLVLGEAVVVPHDRCPSCWGEWDFKFRNPSCKICGIALGKDVKVLLDTDICPHCEKGKVSMSEPRCQDCGFEINLDYVNWG